MLVPRSGLPGDSGLGWAGLENICEAKARTFFPTEVGDWRLLLVSPLWQLCLGFGAEGWFSWCPAFTSPLFQRSYCLLCEDRGSLLSGLPGTAQVRSTPREFAVEAQPCPGSDEIGDFTAAREDVLVSCPLCYGFPMKHLQTGIAY